ncbi:hypothetical protein [Chlamydia vaughanii]|uniref:hypothetical protein n=1 Tax=Chlamydia vaughanii TaxID=3112552 RepID=UPI0032B1E6F0
MSTIPSILTSVPEEPLNIFSKGSTTRQKLVYFLCHSVIHSLALISLAAGIISLACCVHPLFLLLLPTLIPLFFILRHLATEKLKQMYITLKVYPKEALSDPESV